eukprot:TRINITY_DN18656_c0_g1_i1.p1 TRINITY_DN18656_c0_g1~~TRINITY_DN18656_c0_g1_i1.p1  ORF type:complete len:522 (+),score=198.22 TRINITY_DN18656_c0_g1_i1:143-1708(+)
MLKRILYWVLRLIEVLVDALQAFSMRNSSNKFLEGAYAPIEKELDAINLPVDGVIPPELHGEFVRNGPNPKYVPKGGYHWFDGDGMLHGVRMSRHGVNYVNRFVRTERFEVEAAAGRVVYPRLGQWRGVLGLFKVLLYRALQWCGAVRREHGDGTANTAVAFHDGRLLALVENDHPYALRILSDGAFETLGRYSYHGKLSHPFTAHPKVDGVTGELLFFGYQLDKKPYCQYTVVDAAGELQSTLDIGLTVPVMMHDFAITEHYSLFMNFPLEFRPQEMVRSGTVWHFNRQSTSQIGVVPRHAKDLSEMRWFEFKPCYGFHSINAWEEGDEIVLLFCRSDSIKLDHLGTEKDAVGLLEEERPYPHEFRMNLKTGECSESRLVDIAGEFPVVDWSLLGRRTEVCFMGTMACDSTSMPSFDGVVKLDISTRGTASVLGQIKYGEHKFGGECQFVGARGGAEGEGYLMTFVTDEQTLSSEFWVLDATTMDSNPIAVVKLPQRVPYGFHGIFVEEEKILNQREALE